MFKDTRGVQSGRCSGVNRGNALGTVRSSEEAIYTGV